MNLVGRVCKLESQLTSRDTISSGVSTLADGTGGQGSGKACPLRVPDQINLTIDTHSIEDKENDDKCTHADGSMVVGKRKAS